MSKMSRRGHFATIRIDIKAAILECVGTTFFLLFGLGGIQAATAGTLASSSESAPSQIEHVLYISTSMGLSLLVSAWLFFRITGGLFNPNITLALMLVGVVPPVRFVLMCIAQLVGAIIASAILCGLTPGPLASNTFLQSDINAAQGVFIEMFATAALVTAVLMLAAEKHQATPFAPIGIGLTLFACHLFAVFYTGAAMNTARAFGPAVVTGFTYPHHWVYWLGPFLGSLLASGFYILLKYMHYQDLNPAQASTNPDDSPAPPILATDDEAGTQGEVHGEVHSGVSAGTRENKGPKTSMSEGSTRV